MLSMMWAYSNPSSTRQVNCATLSKWSVKLGQATACTFSADSVLMYSTEHR